MVLPFVVITSPAALGILIAIWIAIKRRLATPLSLSRLAITLAVLSILAPCASIVAGVLVLVLHLLIGTPSMPETGYISWLFIAMWAVTALTFGLLIGHGMMTFHGRRYQRKLLTLRQYV